MVIKMYFVLIHPLNGLCSAYVAERLILITLKLKRKKKCLPRVLATRP